jgi:hemerythrin-like domain-containing protein
MKVIRRFKAEHKDIMALLSELWREVKEVECTEQNVVDCERMRIFVSVRDAITQYSDIEERFFFPALERFVETRALINEAYREHRRISDLVAKMEKFRLAKQCDRWDEDLTQLIQSIRRHFDWEEHALFPRAIRLLGEAGLERMHFEIEAASSGQVRNKQRGFFPQESRRRSLNMDHA